MILLAEPSSLAAQKKRQLESSESLTSTPKNRVWGFEKRALGRPEFQPDLSVENAIGSVQYSYESASGRGYFYTRDHLGSIRELIDSSGVIQARYNYDPYGRATQVSGGLSCDFQYAGMYAHATSGLNLTFFRAYDPNVGRWISRDPSREGSGINLYEYCGGNPINFFDKGGLDRTYFNRAAQATSGAFDLFVSELSFEGAIASTGASIVALLGGEALEPVTVGAAVVAGGNSIIAANAGIANMRAAFAPDTPAGNAQAAAAAAMPNNIFSQIASMNDKETGESLSRMADVVTSAADLADPKAGAGTLLGDLGSLIQDIPPTDPDPSTPGSLDPVGPPYGCPNPPTGCIDSPQ